MAEQPPPPPESPDYRERRRYPRFQPLAQVEFKGGGEVAVLPIMDISTGGIRLEMNANELLGLEIDEEVVVFLDAEGDQGPVFVSVPAIVLRIQRSGDRSSVAMEWGQRSGEVASRFDAVLRILETQGRAAARGLGEV